MLHLESRETQACVAGGSVAGFNQCMAENWAENTITGAVSGAMGGAVFGPGAALGFIVGGVGGSTGTGVYCALSALTGG
ncbi:hypothetical protein [Silanimonas sp.]|jgi:hypothetical protein|uniref:hypothetical protein n=1 Tax=Silanimonas sp. TaxID=1929290 RepID=UPI0022BF2955|nr:hypothetical protein [Silanimonas sp.]MCZ8114192.1 hypothetical protein [Silanimonas sp.]